MRTLLIAVLLLPPAALAQAKYKLGEVKLTYRVQHPLHEVNADSTAAEGAAVLKGGGAQVQVRAKVASFDSSDSNRDAHMLETLEAHKFPFVTVKGTIAQ